MKEAAYISPLGVRIPFEYEDVPNSFFKKTDVPKRPTHILLGQKQRAAIMKELRADATKRGDFMVMLTMPLFVNGLQVLESPREDCCEYGTWHISQKQVAIKYSSDELRKMVDLVLTSRIEKTKALLRAASTASDRDHILKTQFKEALTDAQYLIDRAGLNMYDFMYDEFEDEEELV